MIETCLKCGHVNNAATGAELDPCPQCGAIYSKVEAAMAAKPGQQAKERGNRFWTYAVLFSLLAVLVPLTIYEHTWGSSAKRRQSEASLGVAVAEQRAVVFNSGLDGSVFQVERWLKSNLKDPASLEVIEWSRVVPLPNDDFQVRVKYRAKNSYGGYAIEQKFFRLDSTGTVVGVSDV